MIIKCAIIDDEPLALSLIASYVNRLPVLELCGEYSSAVEAISGLNESPADLIFVDIHMPDLNGLEFAKMAAKDSRIIFITAFGQYAIEGYRVNALDYLMKPVSFADFTEAVNKAVSWFALKQKAETKAPEDISQQQISISRKHIYVKSEYKIIQIELDNILYIEGLKDYLKIYTEDSDTPVITLGSMKLMEEKLPSEIFMRVHRSFLVNLQKVKAFDRGRIFIGEEYIPISDSYRQPVMNYINDRMI